MHSLSLGVKRKYIKGDNQLGVMVITAVCMCVCVGLCVGGGLCSGEHVRMRVNFSSVSLKVAKCLSAT